MAFPTIIVNNSTGHDTQASGAGPSTAVYGGGSSNAAEWSSLTFTLGDMMSGPDLSGVATDGSHVIWVDTSTGRQWFTISAKDESAFTVTVNETIAGDTSGLTWAIGGKRADCFDDNFRKLFQNNSGNSDIGANPWKIKIEHTGTDYVFTSSAGVSPWVFDAPFGSNTAPVEIYSDSATKPVIQQTNTYINGATMLGVNGACYLHLRGLNIVNNSTKAASTILWWGGLAIDDCVIEGFGGQPTSYVGYGVRMQQNSGNQMFLIHNSVIKNMGGSALYLGSGAVDDMHIHIMDCVFYKCSVHTSASAAVAINRTGANIIRNIFRECGASGANSTAMWLSQPSSYRGAQVVEGNTFFGSVSSDIDLRGDATPSWVIIKNNISEDCGGYFIKNTADKEVFYEDYNNVFNATSGSALDHTMGTNSTTTDPAFTDSASGDFSRTTDLPGFPGTFADGLSTGFIQMGAVKPAAGGGGGGSPQLINGGLIS